MNESVALSASEVAEAKERVEGATVAVQFALDILNSRYEEWTTLQKALQILTRHTQNPYVPVEIPHPLIAILDEWKGRLGQNGSKAEQPANRKREKIPPPPPYPTKIGIVYDAMVAAALDAYKVDDILAVIPPEAPISITREDIYRILPKLLNQGKIWRDKRGIYHVGPPPPKGEVRELTLINEDEEQPERMPLAG